MAPAREAPLRLPRLRLTAAAACAASWAAPRAVAAVAEGWQCSPQFTMPPPGHFATDHNGVALQPTCMFPDGREHHVFVIGDWGGIIYAPGMHPIPADHRSKRFKAHHRDFIKGADDVAQMKVAEQMKKYAKDRRVDYVLNVGDNFYWGGIDVTCGLPVTAHAETGQWGPVFEEIYKGPGLDGKPWLGVLGNHDYGGYQFNKGWDQSIAYTWAPAEVGSSGRWKTPAQYWSSKVQYKGFDVDYFFLDSNVFDAYDPNADPAHNICSLQQNQDATCGPMGPVNVWDCPGWFSKLWAQQMLWLEEALQKSTATWQIIVTHFPPDWGLDEWSFLAKKYGIDLFIAGHKHIQTVYGPHDPWNLLPGTAVLVSGGGGGITSEGPPSAEGHDDQYGFMDLIMTKDYIQIDAISHGGERRTRTKMPPRPRGLDVKKAEAAAKAKAAAEVAANKTAAAAAAHSSVLKHKATVAATGNGSAHTAASLKKAPPPTAVPAASAAAAAHHAGKAAKVKVRDEVEPAAHPAAHPATGPAAAAAHAAHVAPAHLGKTVKQPAAPAAEAAPPPHVAAAANARGEAVEPTVAVAVPVVGLAASGPSTHGAATTSRPAETTATHPATTTAAKHAAPPPRAASTTAASPPADAAPAGHAAPPHVAPPAAASTTTAAIPVTTRSSAAAAATPEKVPDVDLVASMPRVGRLPAVAVVAAQTQEEPTKAAAAYAPKDDASDLEIIRLQ